MDNVIAIAFVEGQGFTAHCEDGTTRSIPADAATNMVGFVPPSGFAEPVGLGRRFYAGLRSLSERANLFVDLGTPNTVEVSHYGDTDTATPLVAGDDEDTKPINMSGRRARVEGALVLHTTVGGRPEWRLADDSRLLVWPSDGAPPSEVEISRLPYVWRELLVGRLVSEAAAMMVRSL